MSIAPGPEKTRITRQQQFRNLQMAARGVALGVVDPEVAAAMFDEHFAGHDEFLERFLESERIALSNMRVDGDGRDPWVQVFDHLMTYAPDAIKDAH